MLDVVDLNPCKLCGKPAELFDIDLHTMDNPDRTPLWVVDCTNPHCQRVCPFDEDHMIAAWNALNPIDPSPKQRTIRTIAQLTISILCGIATAFLMIQCDLPWWFGAPLGGFGQWLLWKMAHYEEV